VIAHLLTRQSAPQAQTIAHSFLGAHGCLLVEKPLAATYARRSQSTLELSNMAQPRVGTSNFNATGTGTGHAADAAGMANLRKLLDTDKPRATKPLQPKGQIRPLGEVPGKGYMQPVASSAAAGKGNYRSEADRDIASDTRVSVGVSRPSNPTASSAASYIRNSAFAVEVAQGRASGQGLSSQVTDVMGRYAASINDIADKVAAGRISAEGGMNSADRKVGSLNDRIAQYSSGGGINILGF
jgi:hypothetical protein